MLTVKIALTVIISMFIGSVVCCVYTDRYLKSDKGN